MRERIPVLVQWDNFPPNRPWHVVRLDTGEKVRREPTPNAPAGWPYYFATVAAAWAWIKRQRKFREPTDAEFRAAFGGHAFNCNKLDDVEMRYSCNCGAES